MSTTRMYSAPWIFDGWEFHRAAVSRSEDGEHFYPRVDVRSAGSAAIATYKPAAADVSFATVQEAHMEAENARDEWERGRRSLHPAPESETKLREPMNPLKWAAEKWRVYEAQTFKARMPEEEGPERGMARLLSELEECADREEKGTGMDAAHKFSVGELVTRMDFRGREYGVCCAVHAFTNGWEPRYHFVFDSGAILERSGSEAAKEFELTGRISASLAKYEAENFDRMYADCTKGMFHAAFEEGRALAWPQAQKEPERSASPQDLDIER